MPWSVSRATRGRPARTRPRRSRRHIPARARGPGGADEVGRRVQLQVGAERSDPPLIDMPDPGELHRAAFGGQPDRAPVGEPGHQQLGGERGDHVLVELPGQQFAGLGEEGRAAAVGPLGGVAVRTAALGDGPVRPHRRRGGPRLRPGHGPDRAGLALGGLQSEPHGLHRLAVGHAPRFRQRAHQLEAVSRFAGAGVHPAAYPPGRMAVGDLHDQAQLGPAAFPVTLGGLVVVLQPAGHIDLGTGVHHGIGDQLAGEQDGVVDELRVDRRRAGPCGGGWCGGSFGEQCAHEFACAGGRELVRGQAFPGHGFCRVRGGQRYHCAPWICREKVITSALYYVIPA